MKIKKITLAEVQAGSLQAALHKKELLKAIQIMEKEHAQADQAVDFFLKMDQTFDGVGDKPELLCLLGQRKNEWKSFLKEEVKTNKKQVLMGQCYLQNNEKGENELCLIVEKGNAKLDKIFKAGKTLFKKAKISLKLAGQETNASTAAAEVPESVSLFTKLLNQI